MKCWRGSFSLRKCDSQVKRLQSHGNGCLTAGLTCSIRGEEPSWLYGRCSSGGIHTPRKVPLSAGCPPTLTKQSRGKLRVGSTAGRCAEGGLLSRLIQLLVRLLLLILDFAHSRGFIALQDGYCSNSNDARLILEAFTCRTWPERD